MLTRVEAPSGEESWTSPRGSLTIRHPGPGVVLFIEKGFLVADFAAHIRTHSERALEQSAAITLFVDGFDLDGYDPEIRNAGSAFLKEHGPKVVAQHMLVRSRLAKMGLSVVSLMFGGLIKGHHERNSFDGELAAAIRSARSASGITAAVSGVRTAE